jgi:hypothetical protein
MSTFPDFIDDIRARASAATPGPWGWFGNTDVHHVYLATQRWGRHLVMDFRRWGMQGAQPEFWNREDPGAVKAGAFGGEAEHVTVADAAVYEVAPTATSRKDRRVYRADLQGIRNADATFIAHSRADIDALLAEVDRLQGLLAEGQGVFPVLGEVRQVGWYCEHRYGTPDAGTHKKWDYRKGKLVGDKNTIRSLAYNSRPDDQECPASKPIYVRAVLGGDS